MNKTQLVDAVSARIGDRRSAAVAVNGVLDAIVSAVGAGETVAILGFGVFEGRARSARVARNPRTGAAVAVPATTVPAFRPGAGFRAAVGGVRPRALVGRVVTEPFEAATSNGSRNGGAVNNGAVNNGAVNSSSAAAGNGVVPAEKPRRPRSPATSPRPVKPVKTRRAPAAAFVAEAPAVTPAKLQKLAKAQKPAKAELPAKPEKPGKSAKGKPGKPGKDAAPVVQPAPDQAKAAMLPGKDKKAKRKK